MRVPIVAPGVVLSGAALGGVVTVVTLLPGPVGVAAAVGVLCFGAFLLWPWAVLPVGIIGGAVVGALLSGGDVRGYIAVKVLLLAAGGAALAARHWLGAERGIRRTAADVGMLVLVGLTVVAATYGLAVGNLPTEVLVAAYQVATIPVYFFVATHTLTTPRRILAAGILYVVLAGVFTAISVAAPGRHGGLITLMAIPALIWIAGRVRGWRRAGALLLGGFFAVDVLLASYRGIWLAAALTGLIMLLRGGRTVRAGLAATAAAAVAVAAILALQPGVRERATEITKGFGQSAGYRGWSPRWVWASSPTSRWSGPASDRPRRTSTCPASPSPTSGRCTTPSTSRFLPTSGWSASCWSSGRSCAASASACAAGTGSRCRSRRCPAVSWPPPSSRRRPTGTGSWACCRR